MRRTALLVAALAALSLSLSAFAAVANAQTSSSFAQLAGRDGCVVQTLPASYYDDEDGLRAKCDRGHGLLQAEGVAVSPDQADVYVASAGTPHDGSNAVVAFKRD